MGKMGVEILDVRTNKLCRFGSLDTVDEAALVYKKTTIKIKDVNALINVLELQPRKETISTTQKNIGMQLHICIGTLLVQLSIDLSFSPLKL